MTAEHERQPLRFLEDNYKYFSDEIKSSISEAKKEIVNMREPVGKISSDILKRTDRDISLLIENKIHSFHQTIDHSLKSSQQGINSFVENELKTYGKTFVTLTQKGVSELGSELKNYTNEAKQKMANHMKYVNNELLQKLDATQKNRSTGKYGENINQDNLVTHLKSLLASIDLLQKQNKVHLEFSECLKSVE
ncbi:hypothetical protein [Nitrosomonas communis]|uniref:hypothetical protein n=1 Tax=Nitrosomonas communis TaxID=44574 RepID=UPI003D2B9355